MNEEEKTENYYCISFFLSTGRPLKFGPYKFNYYQEENHLKGVGFLFWIIGVSIKKETSPVW